MRATRLAVVTLAAVSLFGGPGHAASKKTGGTNLLFRYVTNQLGFDTGLVIANTTADPFGTTPQDGSCILSFFGSSAPVPVTTGTIAAGTLFTFLASSGAPGFQGYVVAECDFPLAHGFVFVSDVGARNVAMGDLALVIPSGKRKPGERLGQ